MFITIQLIAFILSASNAIKTNKIDVHTLQVQMSNSKPALYKKIPTKWTKTLEK